MSALSRKGLSLVELLVALFIIGVLIALLLPAVQYARSAARKMQCHSNLRQLALANSTHETTHGHFPTGGWGWRWLGVDEGGYGMRQPGGWLFNILPFVESQSIRDLSPKQYEPNAPSDVGTFLAAGTHLLICPQRGASTLLDADQRVSYLPSRFTASTVFRTDYAINGGSERYPRRPGPNSANPGDFEAYDWADTSKANGISFVRSQVTVASVLDGTSNVLLLGEKWANPKKSIDSGFNQAAWTGDSADIRRFGEGTLGRDGNNVYGHSLWFGSAHTSGVPFAYCDGSVRELEFHTDIFVVRALAARNDNSNGVSQ